MRTNVSQGVEDVVKAETRPLAVDRLQIAVVIPCYRVRDQVLHVLARIGEEVKYIYCIDDCCPEDTGRMLERTVDDPRVRVIFHESNQGVGGATLTGYKAAIADGATIIVKIDGDGQMDPTFIPRLVEPILADRADYAKGNRFYQLDDVRAMPRARLFGNAVLSFISKFASGYYFVFDPTNGYTAIHAKVAALLPFDKISRRYFFESDMLFRLNCYRAVVADIPMPSCYGAENSSLKIERIVLPFLGKYLSNFLKRIFYNYFLRDFSIASVELLLGIVMFVFGVAFGATEWASSLHSGSPASAGTVMLAALPIIVGVQLLLSFLNYDMQSTPRNVLHRTLD